MFLAQLGGFVTLPCRLKWMTFPPLTWTAPHPRYHLVNDHDQPSIEFYLVKTRQLEVVQG